MVKKIVLTLFFSVFLGIFIAFNYLLIQKENTEIGTRELEQEMTAKSATIANQVDRIGDLERRTSDLIDQVASLREQNDEKESAISSLEKITDDQGEMLGRREDLINKLKQGLDVEQVGQQAREWIEFINSNEYEKAYARFNRPIDNAYTTMILSEFREYYSRQVGMVEVKSIDVMTRGIPETIDNDLVVAVVVDLITPRSLELFIESLEERGEIARIEAEAIAAAEEAVRKQAEEEAAIREAEEAATKAAEEEAESKAGSRVDGDGATGAGAADGGAREGGGAEDGDGENGAGENDVTENDNGSGNGAGASNGGGTDGAENPTDVKNAEDAITDAGDDGNAAVEGSTDGGGDDGGAPRASGAAGEASGFDINTGGDGADLQDDDNDGSDGEEPDPYDKDSYVSASQILEAMAEFEDYLYSDELDISIFNTGENQFFFLMNYKKEANDWEIIRVVQKL